MNLPGVDSLGLTNKKVLVRADLDVEIGGNKIDKRLEVLVPTLEYLNERNCEIILIGHRGRPDGKFNQELSLKPVSKLLEDLLKQKWGDEKVRTLKMQMMENLRFDEGEQLNNQDFAKQLAEKGNIFVNEAFAVSHRKHASIVGIPKYLPHAAGFRFINEVKSLSKALENAQKPLVFIISGIKKDKLDYIERFADIGDKVLIAGRLPDLIKDGDSLRQNSKVVIAVLLPDKEDITIHSIEKFKEEINKAGTIILSGPIGKFEEEGHRMGTERIFEAVANSKAFKIAGGGDTEEAISLLNLAEKFDTISIGGGAMLEFLATGSLPGIEALLN